MSILRDYETGSYWHHISGEALHGPRAGERMEIFTVLQTTVETALADDPDLEVAISDRPIRQAERWAPLRAAARALRGRLLGTIDERDARLDDMAIGTGIWTDDDQEFIPMEAVDGAGGFVFTELDGRRVLAYIDPASRTLLAVYTDATSAEWDDDRIVMDDGRWIRGTAMYDGDEKVSVERPLQVFTRWYGFSLSFEGVRVFR